MLAQRAAWEGPRWTRAVEDQSASIPEKIASELGGIIRTDNSVERSTRAVGIIPATPSKKEWGEAQQIHSVVKVDFGTRLQLARCEFVLKLRPQADTSTDERQLF